jgi:hypothetical protein
VLQTRRRKLALESNLLEDFLVKNLPLLPDAAEGR